MSEVIRRLSLLDIGTGLLFIGFGVLSASEYMASLSPKEFFGVVLPLLLGLAVILGLLERVISGLSWRQLRELRRETRPTVCWVAGLTVFMAFAILLAPPMPKGVVPFLPKLNIGTAVWFLLGIMNFIGGLANLLRAPDPSKWSAA